MNEMTPRQRVLETFAHRSPDRMPVDLMGTAGCLEDGAYFALCDFLGLKPEGRIFRHAWNVRYYDERILELLGVDFRRVWMRPLANRPALSEKQGDENDEWGMLIRHEGHAAWFANEPLAQASIHDLDTYPWPNPGDPCRIEGLAEEARDLRQTTHYAVSARQATSGLFELAQRLRGPERLLMDLLLDKPFAHALLRRLNEIRLEFLRVYLGEAGRYIDMIEYADDFGAQNGPLISTELFAEFFLPAYAEQNELIRKLAPGARIFMHSDGNIAPLIPLFIESGVDVLNPVEPDVPGLDPAQLKREHGAHLVFHGHINTKGSMRGSLEDVRAEVDRIRDGIAVGGGFIMAPTNHFQVDVPPANIVEAYHYARISKESHELAK